MSPAAEKLMPELAALSPEDRAGLARFLIETLDDAEPEADVQAAWEAEVNRRLQDIADGKVVGIPAEEVFAANRARYS